MANDKEKDVLDKSSLNNLTCLKNEFIKSSKFMDDLSLADMQQVEHFFDLLDYFNLTMKIQTEKEYFHVLSKRDSGGIDMINLTVTNINFL